MNRQTKGKAQRKKSRKRVNGFLLVEALLAMLMTALGASLCVQALMVFKQADHLQFYEIEKESVNCQIVYETDWQAIERQKERSLKIEQEHTDPDSEMAEKQDPETFQEEDLHDS